MQSDTLGNVSPTITLTAPDFTAPEAPTATIAGDGAIITGTGEPGATVTVRDAAGQPLGTATVDAQGNYTLPLTTPQANGGTLTVTQADVAGNTSPPLRSAHPTSPHPPRPLPLLPVTAPASPAPANPAQQLPFAMPQASRSVPPRLTHRATIPCP